MNTHPLTCALDTCGPAPTTVAFGGAGLIFAACAAHAAWARVVVALDLPELDPGDSTIHWIAG
jgi:hypothetical protein